MGTNTRKDVVVIGGGPGGYVAAIRLGQLGKSVAVVNKGTMGGVCLNWGCIPSKALIHAAKTYEALTKDASTLGIAAKEITVDLAQTQRWKSEVVKRLTDGVRHLCKSSRVEMIQSEATFVSPNKISLASSNAGEDTLEFQQAVVATGSLPIEIPGFSYDGTNVVGSKDALEWTKAPKRMAVIGGGVIGLEIGMLYQKFGTEVTVVEMMDQLLPGIDGEIAKNMHRICKKKKMSVHLSSKALGYKKTPTGLILDIETPKGKKRVECDVILLTVGRRSNGQGIGLEKIGVGLNENGSVPVNERLQTNLPHIYAIGDVTGPPLLAHKASKQGIVAAEIIAGHAELYDVRAMPGAIFTDPEIATVGLTEEEAKVAGKDYFIGKFPFAASGRALTSLHTDGFAKVIGERKTNLLLGTHIMGPGASDLISEASLGIEMGATVDDLALTVHPHPTLSEAVMEAAEASLGKAIHTMNTSTSPPKKGHEFR